MHQVAKRFLKYVGYDTKSDYDSAEYPSTEGQLALARVLAEECRELGLSEVSLDKFGYVTAALPANAEGDHPVIGFFAHMDTSSDTPGYPVKPRVVEDYSGGDIFLNDTVTLSPVEFPHLLNYKGQDLIVTDGSTLLGADNKAGIAEILTAMEYLIAHPEIKHGKIKVGFTPDEEVGRGVDHFNVESFGADFAYTLDGGALGELETETFNAARAIFTVTGKSVHPGSAYGIMKNAALIAAEVASAFPKSETPATTKDYDGFYHLTGISGEVGAAKVTFILRDFDAEGLERRKNFAREVADKINARYGVGSVELKILDEYRNMHEVLKHKPEIAERARAAIVKAGVEPVIVPVRGGTDGSRLTFMGLPCPNIFTGGHNYHGPYEYIPIESMRKAVRVIVNICEIPY